MKMKGTISGGGGGAGGICFHRPRRSIRYSAGSMCGETGDFRRQLRRMEWYRRYIRFCWYSRLLDDSWRPYTTGSCSGGWWWYWTRTNVGVGDISLRSRPAGVRSHLWRYGCRHTMGARLGFVREGDDYIGWAPLPRAATSVLKDDDLF